MPVVGKVTLSPTASTLVNVADDVTVTTALVTCIVVIGMSVPVSCWMFPFGSMKKVEK